MRIWLMKVQFEIVKGKHPDRQAFAGYDASVWERHLAFLLGPKAAGYPANGSTALRWEDLLAYEYALRKTATDQVNDEAANFTEALLAAMTDGDLRSTHFTLPLTVSGK